MKKIHYDTVCYALSIALVIGWILRLIRDYIVYKTTLNSAPFYLWVIVDCVYFLLPAGILFVIGKSIKKKSKNSQIEAFDSDRK